MNWISMNVPVVEENIHATIRIHIQEATIELDVPFIIYCFALGYGNNYTRCNPNV
ncbi:MULTISPECIES: hypothetical protein [Bacillus]|uniref:hypothetical protein n=1 Tax=Bacillus TaxID=1386 RepID=UPI0020D1F597|nr:MULTISPECIES: hypothetical protein [Bacillus]MDM5186037.1 hypothetical protein [Bacillus sp. DX4.1]